jgi:hypothetical protein
MAKRNELALLAHMTAQQARLLKTEGLAPEAFTLAARAQALLSLVRARVGA